MMQLKDSSECIFKSFFFYRSNLGDDSLADYDYDILKLQIFFRRPVGSKYPETSWKCFFQILSIYQIFQGYSRTTRKCTVGVSLSQKVVAVLQKVCCVNHNFCLKLKIKTEDEEEGGDLGSGCNCSVFSKMNTRLMRISYE